MAHTAEQPRWTVNFRRVTPAEGAKSVTAFSHAGTAAGAILEIRARARRAERGRPAVHTGFAASAYRGN